MTTAEYAQLQTEQLAAQQAHPLGFPHWAAVRWCAAALYVVALAAYTAAYGIPVQRELVIAWTCGALACRLDRPAAARDPPARPRLAPIVAILAVYDLTRGAADSLGIGVHVTTMIDFDQLRLLRRDPDRVAAGAPLRARRRALVRRRLHPRLHLVLHRPLRHRRRPLGARPARLPALRQAARHPRARRPRDLHRSSPPRRPGWPGKKACSTASTGRPARAGKCVDLGTAAMFSQRPGRASTWSPPSPRCTPPSSRSSRFFLWSRVRPALAAAAAALPAGDGPDPDGDRRALLLRRVLGWALRRRRDGWAGAGGNAAGRRRQRRAGLGLQAGQRRLEPVDRLDRQRVDPARLGELAARRGRRASPPRAGARCASPPRSRPGPPRRRSRRSPRRSARSGGAGGGAGRRLRA